MSDAQPTSDPQNEPRLTGRQRAFVEHYLTCWNASEAARRAGYSEATAGVIGWENLKKPYIAAALAARIAELKISADEVLLRMAAIARGSISPFLEIDKETGELTGFDFGKQTEDGLPVEGTAKPIHLLKKASITRKTFKGVTEEVVTIELYDAQAALVKLGEHHRLWTTRVEVDATIHDKLDTAADEAQRKLLGFAGASEDPAVRPEPDAG
jgi:phage terminase small subunit